MSQQPVQRNDREQPPIDPPIIVDSRDDLDHLRRVLEGVSRLAVDTESNSLFAYREQVCLIQLSTDDTDFLVDPLRLDRPEGLDLLGDIFADPTVEKVLHAAEYDVMCLRRDFGFTFSSLFDTMLAARILGWEHVGLGSILQEHFGVRINKRNQRADWGRRPLSTKLIHYAQLDTHYLLALRDRLHAALEAGGHLEEAREIFDETCQAVWNGSGFDPQGFWHIKGARDLPSSSLAVLRELYIYRENQAMQRDLPVFKIMGDQVLVHLATQKPRSLSKMQPTPGLGSKQIRRYGAGLLAAIQRGSQADPPSPPERPRGESSELVTRRFEALHTWRKERAAARGVPSDIVMSKNTLWELAHIAPRTRQHLHVIEGLGPWRLKMYGDEILRVLSEVDGA
jgi:ribonuclease D